ncbi:hypothetical protein J7T55_012419 [Diaporthe amygdali]|uniref:uncharacterized protein n=1 Tax=Phomopsis amygdali TaxID=1214568 RepID=UPI0022FEAC6A|nr:uncharacterized protein J7T55_012419 [Diaporthe amygdali]KAJ0123947.1 hypothetical protein J7T55_012419 [Diaporthe amygdali]
MEAILGRNTSSISSTPPRYYEILSNVGWREAVLLITLALVTNVVYNAYFHPLSKIPGPFLAGVTELWRTTKYASGQWHQDILDLHRKYGPVVRISPNEVSFVDQAALEQVYSHTTGTKKTSWYDTWTFRGAGTGFFNTTNTQEHAFLRKRVAGAYSKSAIMTQESSVQEVFDHLWRKFRQFAKDGQEIDLQVWANYLAFDVVGKLGMGGPIGFIEGGDTKGILHAVHQIFYVAASSGYLPGQMLWLQWPFVQIISDFFGAAQGFKLFQEWSKGQVRSRIAEGPPKSSQRPRDLLDHFISMKEPDGQSATEPSVLAEVGNLIGAGADTAAVGIAVVMAQLMERPEDLERLRREIDDAYAKVDLSSEDSTGLGVRELEKLPFLNACVQEATRLCPSILWQLPREAPEAGITIAGHYIPPSATLGMSPIAHNRSKEIFGDDADEWRPQRWVPAEVHGDGVATKSDRQRKMEKYNVTFGYGSRVCIGRHLAAMEMIKFVGQFVRQFELEPVDKASPYQRRSQWWCLQENFRVRLKIRDH